MNYVPSPREWCAPDLLGHGSVLNFFLYNKTVWMQNTNVIGTPKTTMMYQTVNSKNIPPTRDGPGL